MKVTFNKTLGNAGIICEADVQTDMEAIKAMSFILSLPEVCGHCESPNIRPDYRITPKESYEYASIFCEACNWKLPFGQSQKNPGVLYTKPWEAPYVPGQAVAPPDTYEAPGAAMTQGDLQVPAPVVPAPVVPAPVTQNPVTPVAPAPVTVETKQMNPKIADILAKHKSRTA